MTFLVNVDDGDDCILIDTFDTLIEAEKCFDKYIADGAEPGILEIEIVDEEYETIKCHSFEEAQ
jgi:hypothetical protein